MTVTFLKPVDAADHGKGGSDTIGDRRRSEPQGEPEEGLGLARAGSGREDFAAGGGTQRP